MTKKAMHSKDKLASREELRAKRLEKTEAYLNSIGLAMPVLKDARVCKSADIIKNDDFIKKIDIFLLGYLEENASNSESKNKLQKKKTRKTILNMFIKQRLEVIIKDLPKIVWQALLTSIMVDNIDEVEGEWLDFEYPLFHSCLDIYNDSITWLRKELSNVGMFDLKDDIADYIDYVCMLVSINLFRFCREVDETSRYQMMGNIGSLEDIRAAVELVFIAEVFSADKNTEWFNEIVNEI